MYDELVKALRVCEEGQHCDLCPKWPDKQSGGMNVCQTALLKEAADAIEERCQQVDKFAGEAARLYAKQPKWIPVTERLPLRGDAVLCVGDNGIGVADFVCGDKWCALPWFYVNGEQETGVTNWMPLPEPPKEEQT